MVDNSIAVLNRGQRELIPDGEYTVQYESHKIGSYRGLQKKIYMTFKIMSGEHRGKLFDRHYNAGIDANKRISAGFGSDLVRDIGRVDEAALSRLDRIPLSVFKNKLLRVRIKSVSKDHRRDNIPLPLRYSKIETVLGLSPEDITVITSDFDDNAIPF